MTPVDEAVERVREDLAHADAQGHHALLMPIEDLRALLSALELGSGLKPYVGRSPGYCGTCGAMWDEQHSPACNAARSASTTDSGNKIVTGMREAVSGEAARVRNVRVAADSGKGRLDAEAGGWRPSKEAVAQAIRDNLHIMAASMTGETGVLSETSIYKATAAILRLPQGEPQPKDTK